MTPIQIQNLVLIVTFVTLVMMGYGAYRYNAKQRAKAIHDTLHGEPLTFSKMVGESATTLSYLFKLEKERIKLKQERLTKEELDAVSAFHYFLNESLVIPWTEAEGRQHWHRASRSKAFAARAMRWMKGEKVITHASIAAEPTPAQLVEELAYALAPARPAVTLRVLDPLKKSTLADLANTVDDGPRRETETLISFPFKKDGL